MVEGYDFFLVIIFGLKLESLKEGTEKKNLHNSNCLNIDMSSQKHYMWFGCINTRSQSLHADQNDLSNRTNFYKIAQILETNELSWLLF